MKPGTVFKWYNFSLQRFSGHTKTRWFIYLGESGPFDTPIHAYLVTTTTQIEGKNDCLFFEVGNSPFDENCILNFNEPCYPMLKERLEDNDDIDIVNAH